MDRQSKVGVISLEAKEAKETVDKMRDGAWRPAQSEHSY
jgi:hypothetical protein